MIGYKWDIVTFNNHTAIMISTTEDCLLYRSLHCAGKLCKCQYLDIYRHKKTQIKKKSKKLKFHKKTRRSPQNVNNIAINLIYDNNYQLKERVNNQYPISLSLYGCN